MRVLVCDDDQDLGRFLQTLFSLEGWQCDVVTSGEACLEVVDSAETPDAVVLDQRMPGLTGTETADRLRSEGYKAPIILCSGHIGPDLAGDIERLKLIPCNKIDVDALVRVVRVAVRDARQSRRPAARGRR
jgi:DNA-binding response OmpR family regulator